MESLWLPGGWQVALVARGWHMVPLGQPSTHPTRAEPRGPGSPKALAVSGGRGRFLSGLSPSQAHAGRLRPQTLQEGLPELPFISHQRHMLRFQTPPPSFCLLCVCLFIYLFIYCLC